ncbi:MAG: hypothetical protein QF578_22805 [Alphaproteobacteria bacterium]|nr:hypothetical protein [Alphaproteobacteria bacterium]MDP6567676.1 hypothetical protein [Alphaproteobacteria bacterium]MDP6815896.1 hypothetical protein [Alphaproteobacteria bacterium]
MRHAALTIASLAVLILAAPPAGRADQLAGQFDAVQGRWLADDASVDDLGTCIVESSSVMTFEFRERIGGAIVGSYAEDLVRRGDGAICPGLGAYHARYRVLLRPAGPTDMALRLMAEMQLLDCRAQGAFACTDTGGGAPEPVLLASDGRLYFRDVAYDRID